MLGKCEFIGPCLHNSYITASWSWSWFNWPWKMNFLVFKTHLWNDLCFNIIVLRFELFESWTVFPKIPSMGFPGWDISSGNVWELLLGYLPEFFPGFVPQFFWGISCSSSRDFSCECLEFLPDFLLLYEVFQIFWDFFQSFSRDCSNSSSRCCSWESTTLPSDIYSGNFCTQFIF